MKTKLKYFLLLILCQACFWSCAGVDNPFEPDNATEVAIRSGQFSPSNVTIAVGETVRWTNEDSEVRTVESGSPMSPTSTFNSPNLDSNDSFEHTFNSAGTFTYYSSITGATGRVVVN